MELLDYPHWSWNKFPRRQINTVTYYTRRYLHIDLYHIVRSIRRFFTGTYSNTIPGRNRK